MATHSLAPQTTITPISVGLIFFALSCGEAPPSAPPKTQQDAAKSATSSSAQTTSTGPKTAAPVTSASSDPTATPNSPTTNSTIKPNINGRPCTEIGCSDGFQVEFNPPMSWAKGHHKFNIETNTGKTTCEITLPLPPCDQGLGQKCTGDSHIRLVESGCALPPSQHGISGVSFGGTKPTSVRITILRSNTIVGEKSFSPEYKTFRPNGEGCGPECSVAKGSLTVIQ